MSTASPSVPDATQAGDRQGTPDGFLQVGMSFGNGIRKRLSFSGSAAMAAESVQPLPWVSTPGMRRARKVRVRPSGQARVSTRSSPLA